MNIKILKNKTKMGILILIAVDQVIKIVINNNFLNKTFQILSPVLYFEPKFNRQYSWVNSVLQLGISKWTHITIGLIISILIYMFYQYLDRKLLTNKIVNIMYVLVFSGALCSLIDKVFWNGSLDYILIKGFFTFDLKDIYLNVFVGMLIVFSLLDHRVLKQIEENNIVKDFIKYIVRKCRDD